jgi:hypothetical protein
MMAHVAMVFAQVRDFKREAGSTAGTMIFSIMFRVLQSPETSGVLAVTTEPLTDERHLTNALKDAIADHLSLERRDVLLIGA